MFPYLRKTTSQLTFRLIDDDIHTSKYARYLGILLHEQHSYKNHLNFLERKISRSTGIISRLIYYLPKKALVTLYFSLVHVDLIYGLPIWASTYKTYLDPLKRLQNKAIRIISRILFREIISPQHYNLKILKLEDL